MYIFRKDTKDSPAAAVMISLPSYSCDFGLQQVLALGHRPAGSFGFSPGELMTFMSQTSWQTGWKDRR